jgi:energy-coupling factor transporter ATP-binding protein EcfA2
LSTAVAKPSKSQRGRASAKAPRETPPASASRRRHPDSYFDHIVRLEISDFKSLKKVEVELAQVSVLVGANGVGKSNLLEAIGILGAAASGRVDDQALLRRGVRPGVPELYKSAFAGMKLNNFVKLSALTASGAGYSATITNPIGNPKQWWTFSHEHVKDPLGVVASRSPSGTRLFGKSAKVANNQSVASLVRASGEPSVEVLLDALDDYAIFSPVTPVLRGIAPDTAPRSPVGLFGGQLPEAIATILHGHGKEQKRELLDRALQFVDWAKGFEIAEPSRSVVSPSVPTMRQIVLFQDRFMKKGRDRLSAYDASEGALYVLFALVLALHPESPRLFAIDNFDQALNPRTARALTSVFVEACLDRGRQAILTTHNPMVLDGLPLDDPRVRLYAVDRELSGQTRVKPVEIRDLEAAKRQFGDNAISQLWLTGRLGGMPTGV